MRRPAPLLALLLAAAATTVPGCSNGDASLFGSAPLPGVAPVSLARDVQPIFTRNCTTAGCHNGTDQQAGLVLESGHLFAAGTGAVGVPSVEDPNFLRIEPGHAADSWLVRKLLGTALFERMPYGAPPLADADVALVRKWIDDGAHDN